MLRESLDGGGESDPDGFSSVVSYVEQHHISRLPLDKSPDRGKSRDPEFSAARRQRRKPAAEWVNAWRAEDLAARLQLPNG